MLFVKGISVFMFSYKATYIFPGLFSEAFLHSCETAMGLLYRWYSLKGLAVNFFDWQKLWKQPWTWRGLCYCTHPAL